MKSSNKKIIYDIITNTNLAVEEIYYKILELFPNYLQNNDEKKVIYEKIE
jgi:hypothetical protein